MIGYIWLFLIAAAVIIGGINGRIEAVTQAAMDSAKLAVDISISLIGIMAFWLGIMKLAEESGLIGLITKIIRPVTQLIFPEIPPGNPAIGNITMNFSANALGLTNAATPIGIKTMKELQKLNPYKSCASNSMCTFLAINTAGFQLIPASVIAVLAASGSKNPAVIIGPTLISTCFTLIIAIIVVKTLEKLPLFQPKYSKTQAKFSGSFSDVKSEDE